MATDKSMIYPHSHTRGEIKRKPGRPKGSVENADTKRAMKRQFSKVVKPGVFRDIVQKVVDQSLEGDIQSQKLIFEYGMIKPGQEVESQNRAFGVQIVINDMKNPDVEGRVIEQEDE